MSNSPSGARVIVRQNPGDPNRFFFDFDPAAPGGKGGASIRFDSGPGFVSIDGVHKNVNLPPRSTGSLLAEGLRLSGITNPIVLEAYNVEPVTAATLAAGGDGNGSLVGNMLQDAATSLGGTVNRWEPIKDGDVWHLRVHVSYP